MKRSRIIAEAFVLASAGVLLPLSLTIYAAWALSVKTEGDRLEAVARQAIVRTEQSILKTADTLRAIGAQNVSSPCSKAHVSDMRRMAMNSRSIEEIGYYTGGMLTCTSWGPIDSQIEKLPADFTLGDDIEAWVNVAPLFSGANPMTVVQVGDHNALIDPIRAIDVLADHRIRLAIVAPNGDLATSLNTSEADAAQALIERGGSGLDEDTVYAVSSHAGWKAVALSDKDQLLALFRNQLWVFLPFGAFAATFIVALIVRFSQKRLSPLAELQIAVRNREFLVHYQPIIALATGRCVGAEALVRWRRPDGHLVPPDLYIPLAEQSGLIEPITDQVIDTVVKDMKELLVENRALHVSINFCADDIRTGRILETVEKRIACTEIYPQQIWFEATERGLMDIKEASRTIRKARARGYSVAIDDFGTGYSSLQYLQSLPLDALKIDKSFVDTIGRQAATSSVVPHIIDMAKALKLSTIAEGIETKEQADYLTARGVEFGQGWYFGKPMPAATFIDYVERDMQRNAGNVVTLRQVAG